MIKIRLYMTFLLNIDMDVGIEVTPFLKLNFLPREGG